jgi:hypothetical protein
MRNVNTRLHRPTVMPDACAEEGGYEPGYAWRENQGDYIHDVPKPKKVPRKHKHLGLILALSVPVGFVLGVALSAAFLP